MKTSSSLLFGTMILLGGCSSGNEQPQKKIIFEDAWLIDNSQLDDVGDNKVIFKQTPRIEGSGRSTVIIVKRPKAVDTQHLILRDTKTGIESSVDVNPYTNREVEVGDTLDWFLFNISPRDKNQKRLVRVYVVTK